MLNSVSMIKCNLLFQRGEDISKSEYYKDYIESLLKGNVYHFEKILPPADNPEAISNWNAICSNLGKYESCVFIINGETVESGEILLSYISALGNSEEDLKKFKKSIESFSKSTGKDPEVIINLIDNFVISLAKDFTKIVINSETCKKFNDFLTNIVGIVLPNNNITMSNTDIVLEKEKNVAEEKPVEKITPFEMLTKSQVIIPDPITAPNNIPDMNVNFRYDPNFNKNKQQMNELLVNLTPEQVDYVIRVFGPAGYEEYNRYINRFNTNVPIEELLRNFFIVKPIIDKEGNILSDEYSICHNAPIIMFRDGVPVKGTFEVESGDKNNLVLVNEFGDRINYVANEFISHTDNSGTTVTFPLKLKEVENIEPEVKEEKVENETEEKDEKPKRSTSSTSSKKKSTKTTTSTKKGTEK